MPTASGPSTTITRRFMILQALCGRWRGSAFGGSSAVEEMKWWRWLGLKRPVPLLQAASDVVAKRSLLPPTWQASIFADFISAATGCYDGAGVFGPAIIRRAVVPDSTS